MQYIYFTTIRTRVSARRDATANRFLENTAIKICTCYVNIYIKINIHLSI